MATNDKPSFYRKVSEQFPEVIDSVERLGTTLRTAGPLDPKTSQLIQLAAAAAMQSEGSVCSHTRRALQAGAGQRDRVAPPGSGDAEALAQLGGDAVDDASRLVGGTRVQVHDLDAGHGRERKRQGGSARLAARPAAGQRNRAAIC